jgi:hypothetical protein
MSTTLENKTCAWYILDKPYVPCSTCNRYNETCSEYIPIQESERERVSRILRNLYTPKLKKRDS